MSLSLRSAILRGRCGEGALFGNAQELQPAEFGARQTAVKTLTLLFAQGSISIPLMILNVAAATSGRTPQSMLRGVLNGIGQDSVVREVWRAPNHRGTGFTVVLPETTISMSLTILHVGIKATCLRRNAVR